MVLHDVVLQLCAHLAVYVAALVLADVGERLRSAENAIVEAGEDIALHIAAHKSNVKRQTILINFHETKRTSAPRPSAPVDKLLYNALT